MWVEISLICGGANITILGPSKKGGSLQAWEKIGGDNVHNRLQGFIALTVQLVSRHLLPAS